MESDQLDMVVRQLTDHPEALRMYKLLYWAQLHHWENDEAVLNRYPLHALLEGISSQVESSGALEQLLMKAALKLTKPTQYQVIAQTIAQIAATLYFNPSLSPSAGISIQGTPLNHANHQYSDDSHAVIAALSVGQVSPPDTYDLRCHLMREVPPLKAKILLFSVLRHPFTFSRTDWWELKRLSLDDWMKELLQQFPSIIDLEMTLRQQAETLPALDQGMQVAIAISKTVRLKHSDINGLIFP